MATNRKTYMYIHTHVRNAVTLVWGSLRFAPMCLSVLVLHPLHIDTCTAAF